MTRNTTQRCLVLAMGLAVLAAVASQAQDSMHCESQAEQYQYCPALTHGGVNLEKPLSRTPCILGSNWGFDYGGIWVDQGCRAVFRLGSPWAPVGVDSSLGYLRCESLKNRQEYCSAPTHAGVTLLRQLSANPCVQGSNWGWDSGGIWVDRGCRAEFRLGETRATPPSAPRGPVWVPPPAPHAQTWVPSYAPPSYAPPSFAPPSYAPPSYAPPSYAPPSYAPPSYAPPSYAPPSYAPPARQPPASAASSWADIPWRQPLPAPDPDPNVLRCESRKDRRQYCPADAGTGVTLLRQLSRTSCVKDRNWGFDKGGIWVDDGCRAEFRLDGK